jgi:hypothetical protein
VSPNIFYTVRNTSSQQSSQAHVYAAATVRVGSAQLLHVGHFRFNVRFLSD